jgi:hypothetical protein
MRTSSLESRTRFAGNEAIGFLLGSKTYWRAPDVSNRSYLDPGCRRVPLCITEDLAWLSTANILDGDSAFGDQVS